MNVTQHLLYINRHRSHSPAPESTPRFLCNHARPSAASPAPASGPLRPASGPANRASRPPRHPSPGYATISLRFVTRMRDNVQQN